MAQFTQIWDSPSTFASCVGKGVVSSIDGIVLRRGVTVADEIGNCNIRDQEQIVGLRQAKKTFFIREMDAARAVLCPYLDCDRDDGELDIIVNGHPSRIRWRADRPYWEDRWTPVEIPVEQMRPGTNEFVFRAVGDAQWTLLIENGRQPDRSAVSEDGGQTWRSEDLGVNNRADGEYMVRLWLDQHESAADCCSEPIDLLAISDVAVEGSPGVLSLTAEAETPSGSYITLFVRGGSTPSYDPSDWTAWSPVEEEMPAPGRFIQWRALLESDAPSVSPRIKAVRLTTEIDVRKEPAFSVAEAHNPDLARSPYRFAHMTADDERGQMLRDRWKLNDVVRDATTDFDRFLHLRQWVREQWEDGWNMGEINFCPPWDAPLILELTSRNLSLGMCTHYATVMSQCSAALGLVARTQIMRSHCINEVWSGDHDKWVAMDVGGDTNDETKFTYHFEREGTPLSALECHQAWVDEDYDDVEIVPRPPTATDDRFEVAKRLQLFERFMISLRNDETTTMGPGEPEHGKGSYHYDGYLFWEDEKTEPFPWFSKHTSRSHDLYGSVNRTRIHLKQTEEQNRLHVTLDVEMPNFSHFERRGSADPWTTCESNFAWNINDGDRRIEIRSVNTFGRPGSSSWVRVEPVG